MKTTIGEWMFQQRDLDRLDCELLVCESLAMTRAQVIGKPEYPLEGKPLNQLNSWVARLRNDEPLAYLTGQKEFWGLSFQVTPDVLIPRPETELLVELALELIAEKRNAGDRVRILDLGTGSGIIAISIAHSLKHTNSKSNPTIDIYASDRSTAALNLAAMNADRHGVSIHWLESNWFQSMPDPFDIIVSNPPYVAVADPHLAALRHEPTDALCAGVEGLDALNVILRDAPEHLIHKGWLLVEHGFDQALAVHKLFHEQGFGQIRTQRDLAGHPRVTLGRLS